MKLRVLFIYDGDYPWDIRVEKVCNTLIKYDCEVHLICRNLAKKIRYEQYRNIHIHRISFLSGIFGKLNDAWTFPFFLSPVWISETLRQLNKEEFDLIIIRDLPMAICGILAGKIKGIPTLLDMAECYPEMLRCTWKFEKFRLVNIVLRNPFFADIIEKIVMKLIDYVFVMIDESRDRLITKKLKRNKIFIVSNTPVLTRFEKAKKQFPNKSKRSDTLRLIYVGLVNASRGLDTAIEAIHMYIQSNQNIEFWIIGDGKARLYLERKVVSLNLNKYIRFLGWIDNKKVPEYIYASDVCIVPHHRCSHWDNTIPNKIFDYMAAGKPVIVSDVPPVVKIINSEQCGYYYKDYDTFDLVSKLRFLEDPQIRSTMGENGCRAVEEKYNWSNEEFVIQKTLSHIRLKTTQ